MGRSGEIWPRTKRVAMPIPHPRERGKRSFPGSKYSQEAMRQTETGSNLRDVEGAGSLRHTRLKLTPLPHFSSRTSPVAPLMLPPGWL
jgi:hypothetical protein